MHAFTEGKKAVDDVAAIQGEMQFWGDWVRRSLGEAPDRPITGGTSWTGAPAPQPARNAHAQKQPAPATMVVGVARCDRRVNQVGEADSRAQKKKSKKTAESSGGPEMKTEVKTK